MKKVIKQTIGYITLFVAIIQAIVLGGIAITDNLDIIKEVWWTGTKFVGGIVLAIILIILFIMWCFDEL